MGRLPGSNFTPQLYNEVRAGARLKSFTLRCVRAPTKPPGSNFCGGGFSSLRCLEQLNKPRKAEVVAKPILRKKRSLKRQIQSGRGKDRSVLQAMAAARNAVEDRNAMLKVQEAKASASTTLELSIKKRQRAQVLMENADLAMYRAIMAIRIAEAAQVADSNTAADLFLDE